MQVLLNCNKWNRKCNEGIRKDIKGGMLGKGMMVSVP